MNTVIYHANCPDGFMAAYCAWEILGDKCDYIACSYQSKVPDVPADTNVYILDFSFQKEQMIEFCKNKNKVVVLDHHKTAQANLQDLSLPNLEIVFDMEKCGAVLTWEYFHPNQEVLNIYKYVQDRDLWQWKIPFSKEISGFLYIQPKEFNHYKDVVLKMSVEEMIRIGKTVLRTQEMIVEQTVRNTFMYEIAGYIVPVVNSNVSQSEIGHALNVKYPNAPFSGIFNFPKGLDTINWSLRSQGNFDVSEIAKKFGGGGHKNAAGFIERKAWTATN